MGEGGCKRGGEGECGGGTERERKRIMERRRKQESRKMKDIHRKKRECKRELYGGGKRGRKN